MVFVLEKGEVARSSRRKRGDRLARPPLLANSLFENTSSGEFTERSTTAAESIAPHRVNSSIKNGVVPDAHIVDAGHEPLPWVNDITEQFEKVESPEAGVENVYSALRSVSASFESVSEAVLDFVVDRPHRFSRSSLFGARVAPATTFSPVVSTTVDPPPILKRVRFADNSEIRQAFIGAFDGNLGAVHNPKVNGRYSSKWVNGQFEPELSVGNPLLEEYVRLLPVNDAIYWAGTRWAGSVIQGETDDGELLLKVWSRLNRVV